MSCRHTGLQGRTGVFEVLEASPRIDKLILNEASVNELQDAARQDGMRTLRESAIEKLASGETSFEEVLRVSVA